MPRFKWTIWSISHLDRYKMLQAWIESSLSSWRDHKSSCGGVALDGAGEGSRGCTIHTTGAPHCTRHVLHDLRKCPQTWKTGRKKRSQKSNSKVSMSLPFLVIRYHMDRYVCWYTITGIYRLVVKQSVYGRTQNMCKNSDRQTEQRWLRTTHIEHNMNTWVTPDVVVARWLQ